MHKPIPFAPGWPGIKPSWTSSDKTGVGTALNQNTQIWFTLSHGIINEIYFPRLDTPSTRDMEMLVTNGRDFFSEEKRHTHSELTYPNEGVPLYQIVNRCKNHLYQIEKRILADPLRDSLLQRINFIPEDTLDNPHLYVLLSPHLGNMGYDNTAWIGEYKGTPMLFAQRQHFCLALACSAPWLGLSVGFVGTSDGWQDLHRHKRMTMFHERAENGNVALIGEIDWRTANGPFLLSLGFGLSPFEAGNRALASLQDGYSWAEKKYVQEWLTWHDTLRPMDEHVVEGWNPYRVSATVLRVHESKRIMGSLIASLSFPWGASKSDNDMGGYHLTWPRDLSESAGGLLAMGAPNDAWPIIHYLQSTQENDGHWPQNMWLDGKPYWSGIQLDETAFPIMLIDLARREGVLSDGEFRRLWPMVRKAAAFIARNGPITEQDRWEEDAGYSPFTLAVAIAALLVAAELAERINEHNIASYLRETADVWNDGIDRWTYVQDTDLSREIGVEGYYLRIAPPDITKVSNPALCFIPIKNQPSGIKLLPASQIVSPDALALVRFGLRAPDDPRILNTIKVIDKLLKVETPHGPAWHRYNHDGYGEHEDGQPFDGSGIGRPWPLLTGERAHYELAAGNLDEAKRLQQTMAMFANAGGMFPEQIWDAPDIPKKDLYLGAPSGSAMPLVWAHAEYVKLVRSMREERVFDAPPQTIDRYIVHKMVSPHSFWRFNFKRKIIPAGKILRLEIFHEAMIHWTGDNWQSSQDMDTKNTGLGIHIADLPTQNLEPGSKIQFTFYWIDSQRWEEIDYMVKVVEVGDKRLYIKHS
ncbi:MAG: glucan 1,4-alpha-glucosidase [Pseudomonadota bacterium]|nr:glucan 1,4-alpha-glucosidase [Pseudomonadota bacterium]